MDVDVVLYFVVHLQCVLYLGFDACYSCGIVFPVAYSLVFYMRVWSSVLWVAVEFLGWDLIFNVGFANPVARCRVGGFLFGLRSVCCGLN